LTTDNGADQWRSQKSAGFEKIIQIENQASAINWTQAFNRLGELGIKKLAVLGGGTLISSLLQEDCIDEIWLTICPFLVGGRMAPTPVEGDGFTLAQAKSLQLISVERREQEIFLHYQASHSKQLR
jgi:5-amino-6-(5-phosphoribosylamino)uracil reductase